MAYFELKNSVLRGRRNVYGYILVGFSFLVLSLLTVKIFIPEVNTSAASQTAEQTVGPYKMSMSNDSVATVNIVPTSSQEVYKMTNNLSITNDCAAGATITMTTNSTTSNSLVRTAVNSDSLTKEIGPTTTSGLSNSSWGWSKDNGSTFAAVPKKGATAAVVYDEAVARTSAYTVPVMFGVKVDNTMPSGAYTNDVVYTMTPKQGCLTYAVVWDFDNGTKKSGATYPTSLGWGDTVNLSQLTPTRDGYTFAGWTSTPTGSSSGSSNYTGTETAANLNSGNVKSVTVKAKWTANCVSGTTQINVNLNVNGAQNFDYINNSIRCAVLQKEGYYKLEVWGAQGGLGWSTSDTTGKGGYAFGNFQVINVNTALYVVVGGRASATQYTSSMVTTKGGYNGGGDYVSQNADAGAGSGATHIATVSGLLKNLSAYKDTGGTNKSNEILIVAGGGGGSGDDCSSCTYGHGGGYRGASGGGGVTGGQQASGYAFGQGQSYNNTGGGSYDYGAGGGGWYGGYASSTDELGGAGGSGYIASPNLLQNKGMYMYNQGCFSSTAADTKTTCTNNHSSTATSNYAKDGNGYARITYLGTSI